MSMMREIRFPSWKYKILLILFLYPLVALGNPDNGEFYGFKLNEPLLDINEEEAFWNQFGQKFFHLYNDIFPDVEDKVALSVTPITNTIYNIEVVALFNNHDVAEAFYLRYAAYFDGVYRESKRDTHNLWPNQSYILKDKYALSITYYNQFDIHSTWRDRLDSDFFSEIEKAEIEFRNKHPAEIMRGNQSIHQLGVVIFNFSYNANTQEYLDLIDKQDQELIDARLKYALEKGIVPP